MEGQSSRVVDDAQSELQHTSPVNACHLLALPAELRVSIFTYVLTDVRCRRPIVVWDDVCTSRSVSRSCATTAILLACCATYNDCLPVLYDSTTVEISIRSDVLDDISQRFQVSLGRIGQCSWLHSLRHIEMEVAYNPKDYMSMVRIVDRIHRLCAMFTRSRKLKTVDLIFFDQGPGGHPNPAERGVADPILEAAKAIPCERFVGISRNLAARRSMGGSAWSTLRGEVEGNISEMESFREISYDYWEHAFRGKN